MCVWNKSADKCAHARRGVWAGGGREVGRLYPKASPPPRASHSLPEAPSCLLVVQRHRGAELPAQVVAAPLLGDSRVCVDKTGMYISFESSQRCNNSESLHYG